METRPYKLAPTYQLCQEDGTGDYLLVKDSGTSFSINKEIHEFLETFAEPQLIDKLDKNQIEFFKKMLARGILVLHTEPLSQRKEHQQKFGVGHYHKDYEIISLLSSNAYIETYHCRKDQKDFILKTLNTPAHLDLKKKEKCLTAFRHEILISSHLPESRYFVPPIYRCMTEPLLCYPKVEGRSLGKYLFSSRPDFDQKKKIQTQLVQALSELHSHDIVHGDLHQGNVMITADRQVVVLDFDLSSYQDIASPNSGGYYPYLAPEQVLPNNFKYHKAFINKQTDIYQLGILTYYLFYEELPFYEPYWDKLYELIKKGEMKLSKEKSFTEINGFITACTNLDPGKRHVLS